MNKIKKKKVSSRTKLIETAIDLVRMSSYSDVGVNEICEKAGVTKGAFYHHFKSKATLYAEAAAYQKELEAKLLGSLLSEKHDSLRRLKNMIDFVHYKGCQDSKATGRHVTGCPFFTAGALHSLSDEVIKAASVDYVGAEVSYWSDLIADLVKDGVVQTAIDNKTLARMVYEYVNGVMIFSRISDDEETMKMDLRNGVAQLLGIPSGSI